MRIKCAQCGWLHDSMVTPFKNDVVPEDENKRKYDVKKVEAEFECKHCGVTNNVELKWYPSWSWEDNNET
ncbi:hypothetical protein LCGC14_3010390 [marine sediment metagenome]|uniref:Uncharacterized protein n=1 Tax=marine sediment metagenome TaxID=412755 RepID=A0A0F8XL60_9ZZZZ